MTSSARAKSDCGTVRPSALAVLRLITSSNLVGCSTGSSAGLAPFRILSTNTAERCANGISIEHGHDNRIARNSLSDCGTGVHLWWDDDKELLASVYGRSQVTDSTGNSIDANWITGGHTAIHLDGDSAARVVGNDLVGARQALRLSGKTEGVTFSGNSVALAAGGVAIREIAHEQEEAVRGLVQPPVPQIMAG